jgi:ABC-type uncharacterized transport system auxiliary subunit
MRNLALILLLAALFCGCSSGPLWQRRVYAFSVPADPPVTTTLTNLVSLTHVSISPLFQSRFFTYRTTETSYEQDPYAAFLVPPERSLAEPLRSWIRTSGAFGRLVEPGSGLSPTLTIEVSVSQLYCDFRKASHPVATMEMRWLIYQVSNSSPSQIVLDKVYARETPLAKKSPAAIMTAWDADLHQILEQVDTDYAQANSTSH